jgi:hypothetical protein
MNLLKHSPDLVMSTVYLHMKDKKASGNINNIPVADVLAFYSGVTIYFLPIMLRLLSVTSSSIASSSIRRFIRLPWFSSRDKVGRYPFAWPLK